MIISVAERKLRKDSAVGKLRAVRQMPDLSPFIVVGQGDYFLWVQIQKEEGLRRRLCCVVSLRLNRAIALLVRKVPKSQVKELETSQGMLVPEWPALFSESMPVYLAQDTPAPTRMGAAGVDLSPTLLCVGCLADRR